MMKIMMTMTMMMTMILIMMMVIMMTMTTMTMIMMMLALSHYRGNSVKVEEKCGKVARDLIPTCLAPDDLVFDVDLRSEDDDEKRDVPLCNTEDEQDEPDEQDIFSL